MRETAQTDMQEWNGETTPPPNVETGSVCPVCGSDALYHYGKTRHGKPRLRCLVCGRQFAANAAEQEKKDIDRPVCSTCGHRMHVYKQEGSTVRFRCSEYPRCKTYCKITREDPK